MPETGTKQTESASRPLVTVAMPIYNAGTYLRMAVLSIVKQTEINWELLIIDDGSTDNALATIGDIHDPRIYILQDGVNKGLATRLNEAIDRARGIYFARMDQDDVSYPERLSRQIRALRENSWLDLVATRAIMIDEINHVTGIFPSNLLHNEICARPWKGFYFPHPTWMGKIEWFRKYRYGIPGPYFCEDQELLLRAYRSSRFATVDEILFGYRIRKEINWRKLFKTRKTMLSIQTAHFFYHHQWRYLILALMVTVGRLINDSIKFLIRSFYQPRPRGVSVQLSRQWQTILHAVSDEQTIPACLTVHRNGHPVS